MSKKMLLICSLLISIVITGGNAKSEIETTYRPYQDFLLDSHKSKDSAHEYYYNPFGSPWEMKRSPNKDIPIGLTPGCWRGPKEKETVIPQHESIFLNNSNTHLMYSECDQIDRNKSRIKLLTTAMKGTRDKTEIKTFGYYLISLVDERVPIWKLIHDKEHFFLHKQGMPPTFENRLMSRNNPRSDTFVMDIGNPDFQDFMADYIKKNLDETGLDGFLADWVNHRPIYYSDEYHLVAKDITDNWGRYWGEILGKIRQAIGNDKIIFANTFNTEKTFLDNIVNPIDGLMFEDLIGSKKTRWKDLRGGIEDSRQTIWQRATHYLRKRNKLTVLITNSNANCKDTHSPECFGSRTIEEQRDDARYYTAAFLNIMEKNSTIMFYYTPIKLGPQFLSETYFTEWDLPVGRALGESEEIADHVYVRKFENAEVFWNNSSNEYVHHLTNERITADHLPVLSLRLKPESGEILMHPEKFDARNLSFEYSRGWLPAGDNWGYIENNELHVKTGDRAVRLDSNAFAGLMQPILFEKNKTYKLAMWIRAEKNGTYLFQVASGPAQSSTGGKKWSIQRSIKIEDPVKQGQWQKIQIEFKPEQYGDGFFHAGLAKPCDGNLWLDDVYISDQ